MARTYVTFADKVPCNARDYQEAYTGMTGVHWPEVDEMCGLPAIGNYKGLGWRCQVHNSRAFERYES